MRSSLVDAGLDDVVEVSSAGTGAWHVGERADGRASKALAGRGYDASSHRARQFAASWFDAVDLVLAVDRSTSDELQRIAPVADREKIRLLREFDASAGSDLDVPDPYYGGPDGFDEVLDMIERACQGLLDDLSRELLA